MLKGFLHETVNARQKQRVKKGIYDIQHVNNFHHRLKTWKERLPRIATKYLDKTVSICSVGFDLEQMLISACQKSYYRKVEMLRSA